ncbi:cyclic nucleotide-binding domain-containing protein [Vibrio sp. S11_S32]|uniref:Crp/Fnr family transcriptional regulator n=1 Tax=Vibrio sp. S11_S32 TaxID=2720225 RepID=UPI001681A529|nr:cyclic nucleotide-binding domain-containing protein [Vibrio sp. S11_S32]MBD1577933.1 cyclic nucleotide-binding domain-containing protein [Vibrio sp. S11_S32]
MGESLLTNIVQYLSQIDPFNNLPVEVVEELSTVVQITYLSSGEVIDPNKNTEDKYLYVIRSGSVEQRKLDGQLRSRLGSDDLFGYTFLSDAMEDESRYIVTALENSLLYLIPHSALIRLFEKQPDYQQYFASKAQVRLQTAHDVVWSDKEKGLFIKRYYL